MKADTYFYLAIALVAVVCLLVFPYQESKRFNKYTGAETTYWDAMFLELRINCYENAPKINENQN